MIYGVKIYEDNILQKIKAYSTPREAEVEGKSYESISPTYSYEVIDLREHNEGNFYALVIRGKKEKEYVVIRGKKEKEYVATEIYDTKEEAERAGRFLATMQSIEILNPDQIKKAWFKEGVIKEQEVGIKIPKRIGRIMTTWDEGKMTILAEVGVKVIKGELIPRSDLEEAFSKLHNIMQELDPEEHFEQRENLEEVLNELIDLLKIPTEVAVPQKYLQQLTQYLNKTKKYLDKYIKEIEKYVASGDYGRMYEAYKLYDRVALVFFQLEPLKEFVSWYEEYNKKIDLIYNAIIDGMTKKEEIKQRIREVEKTPEIYEKFSKLELEEVEELKKTIKEEIHEEKFTKIELEGFGD